MLPENTPPPPAPSPVAVPPAFTRPPPIPSQVVAGARWFWWIAGLSVVNSIAFNLDGGMHFVLGLGFTELIDGIFRNLKPLAYALDLVAVGFFVAMGYFGARGAMWPFLVGGIMYLLDAGIYVLAQDWLPVAFHAYALFSIFRGFSMLRAYRAELAANPTL